MPEVAWRRVVGAALIAQLGLLFAGGVWLRSFCLAAIPQHYADEAFYGLQALRLLRGAGFEARTSSGNLLDPFFVAMQVPLHLVCAPSLTVLRVPAVVSGLLAVAAVARLGRRGLDRPTALIGATLLASAPVAILFSRVGCEYSQTPLAGALAAGFAIRGRGPAFFLAVVAALLVHPTNIFLLPILLPVYAAQAVRARTGDRPRQARAVVGAGLAGLAVAVPFALVMRGNGNVSQYAGDPRGPGLFVENFGRFLLSYHAPGRGARWAALGVVLPVLGLGVARLVGRRQWDRLALVAGWLAGLAAFDLLAGASVLVSCPRYGAVLLVPTALALACLARALLPDSPAALSPTAAPLRLAGLSAVGWALLWSAHANFFHNLCVACGREWVWQFRSSDPYERAFRAVVRDAAARGNPAPALVTQEHFFDGLIYEYLAGGRPGVRVASLLDLREGYPARLGEPGLFGAQTPRVLAALEAGGYVMAGEAPAAWGGAWLGEATRGAYPEGRLRAWAFPATAGPWVWAYRLEPPGGVAARPAGAGRERRE